MRKLGLIGFPLGHSFSSGYFTKKFLDEGLTDIVYENYPIDTIERLPEILSAELEGFNVTIPYKQQVMAYLDEIDDRAAEIGAVNCVKVTYPEGFVGRAGKPCHLKGYNSDIYGLELSIKEMTECMGAERALVLGTGGAAKAVFYLLESLNIPYTVVSRTSKEGQISYGELTAEMVAEAKLIINSTPLGMYPNVDSAPDIPYEAIGSNHLLFDLVYNPGETLFLKRGRRAGAMVRSGYYMLKMQAEMGYSIFLER